MDQEQIQKYLQRIQFAGTPNLDLSTLVQLQKQHLLHIPFENLDIHFGRKIVLDTEAFAEKILEEGRGGFCYELNGLFYELLIALGFEAKMISAGVHIEGDQYGPDFDHLAIIVKLEKVEYLVDVGFGEFAFAPLVLQDQAEQEDERGTFVFYQKGAQQYLVGKLEKGQFAPEYIFSTKPQALSAFQEMCDFQQTSPDSHFTKKKMITLPTLNGRTTLSSNSLKIKKGKQTQEIAISDDKRFTHYLKQYFSISPPVSSN